MQFFDSARRSSPDRSALSWGKGMEPLEQRVLLSTTPLPSLDSMTDKNNTLVRIETDMGTVDLEMYDVAGPAGAPGAPKTVENFLEYIREGAYDLSFFHRFAINPKTKHTFVLQGGGFKWSDSDGLQEIKANAPIENEFDAGRSNVARTIAMARLSRDANSATSQWFLNLRDNTSGDTNLDDDPSIPGTGDGYTVFGKVLDNRSWDVVKSITALTTENFYDGVDPLTGALQETPTKHDLDDGPDGLPNTPDDPKPSTAELINLTDVEIIKAANFSTFYRLRSAYPEGFRGPGTVESVELVNPDPNAAVAYQVIVRYEKGMGRDRVISTGTMDPNVHLHIPVNDFNDPTLDLVREGAPYAFEVQATGPVAGALNHYDFGSATSESFVNVDQATTTQLQTWAFGGTGTPIESPPDVAITRRPFLVWDNLGFEPANVTITFTLQTGGRVVWTRTTDPMRRDGLEVFNLANVTRDIASVRITSDQKIVAALTVYDTITDPQYAQPPLSDHNGFTSAGVVGGGLTDGVVAGARYGDSGVSYVSFVNDTDSGASVTLSFIRSGAPVTTALVSVPGRGRDFYNLRKTGIPAGELFTIKYHSPLVAVAGEYVSVLNGDSASTPFAVQSASQLIFAGGRYDPSNAGQSEVVSLYNPFLNKAVSVSITFNFADDKIQGLASFNLPAQGRLDISVASLNAIVAKINSGAQFHNYAIIVNVSPDPGGGGTGVTTGGIVAQLTRFDDLAAITTGAGLYQIVLPLDSSIFAQHA